MRNPPRETATKGTLLVHSEVTYYSTVALKRKEWLAYAGSLRTERNVAILHLGAAVFARIPRREFVSPLDVNLARCVSRLMIEQDRGFNICVYTIEHEGARSAFSQRHIRKRIYNSSRTELTALVPDVGPIVNFGIISREHTVWDLFIASLNTRRRSLTRQILDSTNMPRLKILKDEFLRVSSANVHK